MTDTEIESYRNRLNELTDDWMGKPTENWIKDELKKIARKVGASTMGVYLTGSSGRSIRDADTSELIRNIHQALQTASMINMCRTATQGYKTATQTSKWAVNRFWITTAIAFLIAVAAWVAALWN